MLKTIVPFLLCSLCSLTTVAQKKAVPQIQVLTQDTKSNLRGLSVVNDRVIWVSGNNGTVGLSTDGGASWKWLTVQGFEKRDFRDIEAFDGTTAIIMAVDEPGYILKTTDAGASWKVVYENKTRGIFLDAMEFWNDISGIVIGDPIDGKFFVARTFDSGNTWREIPDKYRPVADSGEGCFAASGTNVRSLDRDEAVFVSGGISSRVFIRNQPVTLPIVQGSQTSGANSIAILDNHKLNGGATMIVVGGDFNADSSSNKNCFYSHNRGKTWIAPKTPPHGYRSCVEYLSKKQLITCGLTGVDYSFDGGTNWQLIGTESFNTCRIAKSGSAVFLAGSNGKIGRLEYTHNP